MDYGLLSVILAMLFVTNSGMRRNYPHEIYAIWYIFSLFFLIFFALYVVAEKKGQRVTEVLGPSFVETLQAIHGMLTNVQDELLLVGTIVYLGVAPQLLTYVLSGLSGSATAPIYVRQIGLVAVWSVIKFLAGLGGILLAQPAAKLAMGASVPPGDFSQGTLAVLFAFAIAITQHAYFDRGFEIPIGLGLRVGFQAPWLVKIHAWLTRHRPAALEDDVKLDVVKDAAVVAAIAAATAAVTVLRDPAADMVTIAPRVIQGVVAIEEATRAEARAAAEANPANEIEHEWVLPVFVASVHFRGPLVDRLERWLLTERLYRDNTDADHHRASVDIDNEKSG
ncbi:hypothetical protein ACVI1L_004753 [Bradyrhizobium sp. USDA 4516]